jgi:hypothetical protein
VNKFRIQKPARLGKKQKQLLIGLGALALLLLVGGIVLAWTLSGGDRKLDDARARLKDAKDRNEREEILSALAPEQQEKLREEQRRQWMEEGRKRMEERLKDYFALSPEEKADYQQQLRDAWEKRAARGPWQGPPGGPRGAPAPGNGPVRIGPPNGPPPNGAQGPPGNADSDGLSQAQRRQQFQQQMIANSNPQMRAMFSDFQLDMNQSRLAQGLPVQRGPFFGPPPPPPQANPR